MTAAFRLMFDNLSSFFIRIDSLKLPEVQLVMDALSSKIAF